MNHENEGDRVGFMMPTKSSRLDNSSRYLLPLSIAACSLLIDFKGSMVASAKINYAPLLACLAVIFFSNPKILYGKTVVFKVLVWSVLIYGLGLSLIMKLISSNSDSYISILLPALILLFIPNNSESAHFRLYAKFAGIYTCALEILTILASKDLLPQTAILNYSFEKIYLFVLGISLCYFFKFKILFIINLTLYAVNFSIYQAGSYLLPVIALIGILIFSTFAEKNYAFILANIVFCTMVGVGIFLIGSDRALLNRYFSYVQKQDNSLFRYYLNQRTIEKIQNNFILGTSYRGEITQARIGNFNIVSHNDYLNMLLGGGLLLIIIFSMLASYTLILTLRLVKNLTLRRGEAKIAFSLILSFLTFLLMSNFLALLSKPSNSFIFYSLIFALISLSAPIKHYNVQSSK
jgi:hypothetical protein